MGNIYTVGPNEALIVSGRRNFTLFSYTPLMVCVHIKVYKHVMHLLFEYRLQVIT